MTHGEHGGGLAMNSLECGCIIGQIMGCSSIVVSFPSSIPFVDMFFVISNISGGSSSDDDCRRILVLPIFWRKRNYLKSDLFLLTTKKKCGEKPNIRSSTKHYSETYLPSPLYGQSENVFYNKSNLLMAIVLIKEMTVISSDRFYQQTEKKILKIWCLTCDYLFSVSLICSVWSRWRYAHPIEWEWGQSKRSKVWLPLLIAKIKNNFRWYLYIFYASYGTQLRKIR